MEGGTLSVDDTVLDKPYSQQGKTELVGYFWSGKHGRAVKGVCLVALLYTDRKGVRLPEQRSRGLIVNWYELK